MAKSGESPRVKLICGMISANPEMLARAIEALEAHWGPADVRSDLLPFDFTHYYDAEMGSPLWRRFAAFERSVPADALREAKLLANGLEEQFAAERGQAPSPGANVSRPVNLDPGYVDESKLVLASMKNFSHRVYLGSGVYAEVTLMYRRSRWDALPWTFPDYASGRYDAFLTAARQALRRQFGKESS